MGGAEAAGDDNAAATMITQSGMSSTGDRSVEDSAAVDINKQGPLSLREALSDPNSGLLMNDAMAAKCGHSFGAEGLRRVVETGSCLSCAASVGAESLVPNHAVRAYLQQPSSSSVPSGCTVVKRKRDHQSDQLPVPKKNSGSKSKGVQFPFSVSDHVVIKGNKRTPSRFFGREAIVTSQCLNGWYLVQMIEGDESIRLQYRSLEKLEERQQPMETSMLSHEVGNSVCVSSKEIVQSAEIQEQIQCFAVPVIVIPQDHASLSIGATDCEAPADAEICSEGETFDKLSPKSDNNSCKIDPSTLNNRLSPRQRQQSLSDELMRAARREMLQLEKHVPWDLLSFAWTDLRVEWRRGVRRSFEIKDVGSQLQCLRQNLLLNSAGGMPDSVWEDKLAAAIETRDPRLLLSLWRRLHHDVHQLLGSKCPGFFQSGSGYQMDPADLEELQRVFPQLQVKGMSPVSIIAATVVASADAIARGEKEAEVLSWIVKLGLIRLTQEALEIPLKLIQRQGEKQLGSIREALEREKRHITARLTELDAHRAAILRLVIGMSNPHKLHVEDESPQR